MIKAAILEFVKDLYVNDVMPNHTADVMRRLLEAREIKEKI